MEPADHQPQMSSLLLEGLPWHLPLLLPSPAILILILPVSLPLPMHTFDLWPHIHPSTYMHTRRHKHMHPTSKVEQWCNDLEVPVRPIAEIRAPGACALASLSLFIRFLPLADFLPHSMPGFPHSSADNNMCLPALWQGLNEMLHEMHLAQVAVPKIEFSKYFSRLALGFWPCPFFCGTLQLIPLGNV